MKKVLAIAAVALCGLSLNAFGQGANLMVTNPITVGCVSDIVFGNVQKMSSKTITIFDAQPGPDGSSPGSFCIHAEPLTDIQFVAPSQFNINRQGGGGTLLVAGMQYGHNDRQLVANFSLTGAFSQKTGTDDPAASAPNNVGTPADGDGEAFIWYGGSINTNANTAMGTYSGTVNIAINYLP